ncbi:hypothetical protein [Paenibacillus nasutitermitis]|uniref:Uncharacterized protein n=1 Tax=Paenibacillus nasutitermitis TaxID=1652958 RepID=A0A916YM07_9BACL|nr:hypothetical protein [Paenibacillus nasutitermitis]GGD51158.1 hypothetical protein GCM10010911_05890 [Paenibacillus nasutitermitis]
MTDPKLYDNESDTWSATDALGRRLPGYEEVGQPREGKFVGMFYFIWQGEHGTDGPFGITEILNAHPEAIYDSNHPAWGPLGKFHHWGEPLLGYYLADDRWVIRQHAQMLANAGVDTVIFDVTNQSTYKKSYMTLLGVYTQMRQEGARTPQVAFLTPFWDPGKVVSELYEDLYGPGLHADLWFPWQGKPLILADPEKVHEKHREFFTFRKPEPSYFVGPSGPDQWSWLEIYPQHAYYNSAGELEQVSVGVAQNAVEGRLGALSEPGARGRSYRRGQQSENIEHDVPYGLNFAEQWERALELDPSFIFVTGWNEWIAMRFEEFNNVRHPVMFVDQFDLENSRDIEPMKGGFGDSYYYQLVAYIRRFKGVRRKDISAPVATIDLRGDFSQWEHEGVEYRDDAGDAVHRNHDGWGNAGRYVNETGRNDLVTMKVAHDSEFLYFLATTNEELTPPGADDWMWLMLSIAASDRPAWEGYHYIVNRLPCTEDKTWLESCIGGWNWQPLTEISHRIEGSRYMLAIPRAALGLAGSTVEVEFKWADNTLCRGDILDFYINGDTAPDGRFNYRYTLKNDA